MIACVCITANRPEFTAEAVRHFREQSIPARMLVYDTSAHEPEQYLNHISERSVLHVWRPSRGEVIGSLRNQANELAATIFPQCDVIANWDSDDHYGVARLERQYAWMLETGKDVVGFHSCKFTDGTNWWKYCGAPQYALGASQMYRVDWWKSHPYREVHVGEDRHFIDDAWAAGKASPTDGAADLLPRYSDGDLMVVLCHSGNTSPKRPGTDWKSL